LRLRPIETYPVLRSRLGALGCKTTLRLRPIETRKYPTFV